MGNCQCFTRGNSYRLRKRKTDEQLGATIRGENKKGSILFPIHVAVLKKDIEELKKAVKLGNINERDIFGYTPLHLAVMTGWKIGVDTLIDNNASPFQRSVDGWGVLQDCVILRQGEMLVNLLQSIHNQDLIEKHSKQLFDDVTKTLCESNDFYVEVNWQFTTWVPILSSYCPDDVIKIWKKQNKIRIDMTIETFDSEKRQWVRSPRSYVLEPSIKSKGLYDITEYKYDAIEFDNKKKMKVINSNQISMYLVDTTINMNSMNNTTMTRYRKDKSDDPIWPRTCSIQLFRDAFIYSLRETMLMSYFKKYNKEFQYNENDASRILTSNVLEMNNIILHQSKDWLGFGDKIQVTVGKYVCDQYEIPNVSMVTRKRRFRLPKDLNNKTDEIKTKSDNGSLHQSHPSNTDNLDANHMLNLFAPSKTTFFLTDGDNVSDDTSTISKQKTQQDDVPANLQEEQNIKKTVLEMESQLESLLYENENNNVMLNYDEYIKITQNCNDEDSNNKFMSLFKSKNYDHSSIVNELKQDKDNEIENVKMSIAMHNPILSKTCVNGNNENNPSFDLNVNEMLAILNITHPIIPYSSFLKDFLSLELPNNGFPMKFDIQLRNIIQVSITFENFKRGKIDDNVFTIQ